MINLLWAFTSRMRGVLAHDVGSCDGGGGCALRAEPYGLYPGRFLGRYSVAHKVRK